MALPLLPLIKGIGLLGFGGAALGTATTGMNHLAQGAPQTDVNVPPALMPTTATPMPMLNSPSAMARFGVPMAPVPPKQNIGTNEMLARAGGAIMSNAAKGGPAAYGAGLEAYGDMMDKNREMERLSAVDQYNAAAAQQSALGKMKPPVAPMGAEYTTAALTAIEGIENAVAKAEASGMNPFDDVTGIMGTIMKYYPGSNSNDVASLIETVVSSVGFDRLQAMRDASPTGGALGQVSEVELRQLNASIANLRQSQGTPQFKKNLSIVRRQLERTVYFMNLRVQQYNDEMRGIVRSSNTTSDQLYSTYNQYRGGGAAQPAQPAQPAVPGTQAQNPAAAAAANPAPAAAPAAPGITNMAPAAPAAPQQQPPTLTTQGGVQYRPLPQ